MAVLLVAATALVACAPVEEQPTPDAVVITPDVIADKGNPPDPVLPVTWPLTGVVGEVAQRPAMSIKIENSPAARPQTGLEQADVVWEEMVEGGITRFNVVYHSSLPEIVGPVRSVRPMDAGISAPLGGLLVFSGGQQQFVQGIRDAGLQVISNDEGAGGFYRTSDRRAPHNLYGRTADFLLQADGAHSSPPAPQFSFARRPELASASVAGAPASAIALTFPFASPGWNWDAASGRWLRTEAGNPAVVITGQQLSAVNVVVLRVQVRDTGTRDPGGNPVPETVMAGSGDAFVATGGQSITGTWSKPDATSPMVLTGADGQPLLLAPGNTWVELVPVSGSSVSIG